MRPSVELRVTPDVNSSWARVTLVVTTKGDDNREHDAILYDQLRAIHELRPDVPVEIWMMTEFASITRFIEVALQNLVLSGSQTLMPIEVEGKRH